MARTFGERIFERLLSDWLAPMDYGVFLRGCVLPDVNSFSDIDRRKTHFVGRLEQDGTSAFCKSCENFIKQFDNLLVRPWSDLDAAQRAFVLGYLCHLAADEPWKEWVWRLLQSRGTSAQRKKYRIVFWYAMARRAPGGRGDRGSGRAQKTLASGYRLYRGGWGRRAIHWRGCQTSQKSPDPNYGSIIRPIAGINRPNCPQTKTFAISASFNMQKS